MKIRFDRRHFLTASAGALSMTLMPRRSLWAAAGSAVPSAPVARIDAVHDTYFGESLSDPYRWIFDNHRAVVAHFAKNPGVLACFFGLAGDYREFDAIWKRNAHSWNLQVANFLREAAKFAPGPAERMGFVLGAMTEGVIYQELIRHTEDLVKLGRKPEDIAEVIAVMWYRAIFLSNPPVNRLHSPGRKLAGLKAPT